MRWNLMDETFVEQTDYLASTIRAYVLPPDFNFLIIFNTFQ